MPDNSSDDLGDYFATMLRVPRDQISTTVNVLDLGADSIMLLEARTFIETRYGRRIEIRRFFEDLNTIEAIAAFLAEAPRDPLQEAGALEPSGMPATGGPAVPAKIGPWDAGSPDLRLMRSQLALVADVIETQNRVVASLSGRIGTRPAFEPETAGRSQESAVA